MSDDTVILILSERGAVFTGIGEFIRRTKTRAALRAGDIERRLKIADPSGQRAFFLCPNRRDACSPLKNRTHSRNTNKK
jgi:hypothetical protein